MPETIIKNMNGKYLIRVAIDDTKKIIEDINNCKEKNKDFISWIANRLDKVERDSFRAILESAMDELNKKDFDKFNDYILSDESTKIAKLRNTKCSN